MTLATWSVLDEIARNVRQTSTNLYVRPPRGTGRRLTLETPIDSAFGVPLIAAFLYANYYAFDPALCDEKAFDHLILLGFRIPDRAFLNGLSRAAPGNGYFSGGWQVLSRCGERELLVQRGGITLTVQELRHLQAEQRGADVGTKVSVRFPKDSLMASPGFYVAYADAGPARGPNLTRIYLNLRPELAAGSTQRILDRLLRMRIPYTYKVLADPHRYRRRDTAVLFIDREHYDGVMPQLLGVQRSCLSAFRSGVPSFTLQIRRGMAVADNPAGEAAETVSFGEHRTKLIAQAICRVASDPALIADRQALRQAIVDDLRGVGLDPERLHLGGPNATDYDTFPEAFD